MTASVILKMLGYPNNLATLSKESGVAMSVLSTQLKRGYCPWPKREMKGQTKSPEYKCWENMIQRCTNPRAKGYENYGGRGISVNPLWRSFHKFLADVGPRPSTKHSLDRIDVNGNYEPGNVRWATPQQQAANTRKGVGYVSFEAGRARYNVWMCEKQRGSFPTKKEAENYLVEIREKYLSELNNK